MRHSSLLMMRDSIDEMAETVRIMVPESSYSEEKKAMLREYEIEAVPICEAILAVDRSSLVFIGSPEIPIVDVLADLPEQPAVIITGYFTIKESGYVTHITFIFKQRY